MWEVDYYSSFTTVSELQLQHLIILHIECLQCGKVGYINVQVDFELDHSGSETVRLNCILISSYGNFCLSSLHSCSWHCHCSSASCCPGRQHHPPPHLPWSSSGRRWQQDLPLWRTTQDIEEWDQKCYTWFAWRVSCTHPASQHTQIQTEHPCGGSGWRRSAYLNMSDSSQQCPSVWQEITTPHRVCGRRSTSATYEGLTYSTGSEQYDQVCGRIIGISITMQKLARALLPLPMFLSAYTVCLLTS